MAKEVDLRVSTWGLPGPALESRTQMELAPGKFPHLFPSSFLGIPSPTFHRHTKPCCIHLPRMYGVRSGMSSNPASAIFLIVYSWANDLTSLSFSVFIYKWGSPYWPLKDVGGVRGNKNPGKPFSGSISFSGSSSNSILSPPFSSQAQLLICSSLN